MMNQLSATRLRGATSPATPRGQQTRQRLLDAAEAVFGEKGYDRASVSEITQRAGVAQGTFYVYFPDKKTIFVELVHELSHRLRAELAEAIAGISGRMEIERVGFRTFFSFVQRHRNLYKIVRQAEFVDEELFRWYYRRLAEGYARGLRRAMEAGELRRLDPESLAYCLMGIGDFIGMRWILWDGDGVPDEVFESLMSFLRAGMAALESRNDVWSLGELGAGQAARAGVAALQGPNDLERTDDGSSDGLTPNLRRRSANEDRPPPGGRR